MTNLMIIDFSLETYLSILQDIVFDQKGNLAGVATEAQFRKKAEVKVAGTYLFEQVR
jgi:hypothetical protein